MEKGSRANALDSLFSRVRGGRTEEIAQFVPPTRFAAKSFEEYRPSHPSQRQAVERLRAAVDRIRRSTTGGVRRWLGLGARREGHGIYLDGGFGVGKTHLLAAFWNASPGPKSYFSFDELMYFIGMHGTARAAELLAGQRLIAVDEWELDDPGNLKMAMAFVRQAVDNGALIVVTSNTLPLELGAGRFSQKDFLAEIDQLASAFKTVEIGGEDYRQRHFQEHPGTELYVGEGFEAKDALRIRFDRLLPLLASVHPIHYRAVCREIPLLVVEELTPVPALVDALRWVHFIDALYEARGRLAVTRGVPLDDLFEEADLVGSFGKKLRRCLSRMVEMLGETSGEGQAPATHPD